MSTDKRGPLALMLEFETTNYSTESLSLTAIPVHYDAVDDRACMPSDYRDDEAPFANLIIRAHNDDTNAKRGQRAYGFGVEYRNPYTVDLRRAKLMVSTLGSIERKLGKLSATYGAPETFAQYVLRVADAIGCTTFLTARSKTMLASGHYHRQMNAQDAASWVERSEWEFIRKHQPAETA